MTREEMDFIGSMNMCDEISNEAYQKIMTHCEEQQPCDDYVDKKELLKNIEVALDATNMNDEYTIGLRNGMRVVKSFVDCKRPDYEKVNHLKKQQPCEDCISREEAIRMFADDDYTVNELRNLSPVTPQPKTGRWIAQDVHNCYTDFRCSECGYIHSFVHLYGEPTADYTYCPMCGAKMQEVENADSN